MRITILLSLVLLTSCSYGDQEDRISILCEEVSSVVQSAAILKDLGAEKASVMESLGHELQDNPEFYEKIDRLISNVWEVPSDPNNEYYRLPEDLAEEVLDHCIENPNLYLDV
jgi:hypothetical protein